ncbi:hypothetical protein ACI2VH_06010 [Ralstonia nicotianae]|uniref:Uncharacterized protein n=1 Tax=Ralstonia nicotianae TaxID=3037696 RepID=A0ABX7ZWR8_9RALS|nr:hypothetical protein [Ralstonia nicotianae]QUP59761.1 hypothetical protein GO999_15030 [Ralstonia nicotianae]
MKLGEIYRSRLELAKQWGLAAEAAQGYEEKLHCRQNALQLQEDASAIAHCIASWGDQEVERLDVDALWYGAAAMPGQYHNPWHLGLSIVQEELASVRI